MTGFRRLTQGKPHYGRQKIGTVRSSTGIYGKRVAGTPRADAVRIRRGRG